MNTDRLLSIFELLLKKDSLEDYKVPAQQNHAPAFNLEQAAVGAVVSEDNYEGHPEGLFGNFAPTDLRPTMHGYQTVKQASAGLGTENKEVVEKVVSPDLGGEIPKQWLESIDAIVDFVKDDPTALAGIDAMILAWLRIERVEPKHGDTQAVNRWTGAYDTLDGEVGFIVDYCIKRGYRYVGRAPGQKWYAGSFVRNPIVKLKDGVYPPKPVQSPATETQPPYPSMVNVPPLAINTPLER